jgi:hypothetical protein
MGVSPRIFINSTFWKKRFKIAAKSEFRGDGKTTLRLLVCAV